MPRRLAHAQGPDEWAAWRVRYERERQGWSQGELARQVTNAGVPMRQQAIWKIENGNPPRKISIGEAMAFTKVFYLDDVSELGRPPEEFAENVVAELKHLRRDVISAIESLNDQLQAIRDRALADPEVWREAVADLRWQILHIEQELARVKADLCVNTPTAKEQEQADRDEEERERQLLAEREQANRDYAERRLQRLTGDT